jgi:hypothetical protein
LGADALDSRLEPLAVVLLILIGLLFLAAIAGIIVNQFAIRAKEKRHHKESASRRGSDTHIDLTTPRQPRERAKPAQRSASSGVRLGVAGPEAEERMAKLWSKAKPPEDAGG